jgi:hypothetical protein
MWFLTYLGAPFLQDGHQVEEEVVVCLRSQTSETDNC